MCIILKIFLTHTHSHTLSTVQALLFFLQITGARDKRAAIQSQTKRLGGRRVRNVRVQSVPSREETNQQINLKVLERPGRTSAVTTDFPALIGDGRLPAGTERRVKPQTLCSSGAFIAGTFSTAHFSKMLQIKMDTLRI